MLDAAYVRDRTDEVRRSLQSRGLQPDADLEQIATLEAQRRRLIPEIEALKREQNAAADEVARVKREGGDPSPIFAANKARAGQTKGLEQQLEQIEQQRTALLMTLPNLPHASVPQGKSAENNVEVRRVGTPRDFDFEPKAHWDLGAQLGILDFERATRMSGARFSVLLGGGARLARALINFMLDLHTREHGYLEVEPPFMVNADALRGTGNLPKFEQDLFKIAGDWNLYLIPTAEVPLTNLHRGEILDGRQFPLRYTAYTPCFRSEAGSYGADVRGLIRQHQFDKVELVKFATAGTVIRRTGIVDAECGGDPEAARIAVSHHASLHWRYGFRGSEDLRHRGVAPEPEDVPGDFFLQQHRSVSGAPGQHPGASERHR